MIILQPGIDGFIRTKGAPAREPVCVRRVAVSIQNAVNVSRRVGIWFNQRCMAARMDSR